MYLDSIMIKGKPARHEPRVEQLFRNGILTKVWRTLLTKELGTPFCQLHAPKMKYYYEHTIYGQKIMSYWLPPPLPPASFDYQLYSCNTYYYSSATFLEEVRVHCHLWRRTHRNKRVSAWVVFVHNFQCLCLLELPSNTSTTTLLYHRGNLICCCDMFSLWSITCELN